MSEKPANTAPTPMEHESFHIPHPLQERRRLAAEGEGMRAADLREQAEAAGIDTSGATTKKKLVDAVKAAPGA